MGNSNAFAPLQLMQLKPEDLNEESLSTLNQVFTQMTNRINQLSGSAGRVTLPAGVDLQGESIQNMGAIGPEHTAISAATAEQKYSASALAPKLESGGTHALKTVRRINDQAQRENYSTFLNGVMNTTPTTNSATVSGSGGTVTVSSGYHYYLGGAVVSFASRTDRLQLPNSVTISSLTRTSGLVTAATTSALGVPAGGVAVVSNVSDSSFNGQVIVASVTGDTFTYKQVAPNASAINGTASAGSVYYYYLRRGSKTLSMAGPYGTDSQQNRLEINKDGTVLIAVVSTSSAGVDLSQSAAGATPPAQTNGNRIINRL